MYIKDQLIKGIASDALQVDLLAKAGVLKTLEQNVSHAEAFESAVRDQMSVSSSPDIARLSTYRRRKSNTQQKTREMHAMVRNPTTPIAEPSRVSRPA